MSTKIKDAIISATIGIIGTLSLLFGTGAWDSKISRVQHDTDIRLMRTEIRAAVDSIRAEQRTQSDRLLFTLCSSHARIC